MLKQLFIGTLSEQYWHTLYFDDRTEAEEAQKLIKQSFDECCDLRSASTRYRVTFCTTYPFDAAHRLSLSMIIGDMAIGYSFNQPDEPEESNGARIRVTHGLCIHCGMQPRASYGLSCIACKRAHLKSYIVPDESDLFCDMPLDRGRSYKTLIKAGQYLWVSLILIIASLVLTLFVGLVALLGGLGGIFVGIALWLLKED
jgi:hypothetical protein